MTWRAICRVASNALIGLLMSDAWAHVNIVTPHPPWWGSLNSTISTVGFGMMVFIALLLRDLANGIDREW